MIVLKDYDGFRFTVLTHPTTYLGIAREKYSRVVLEAEMPESSFAQGTAAYNVGKTPQKSVFHLKVEGTLDPIVRLGSDLPCILKGSDGRSLQICGTVHSGNCFVVSKKGDEFKVSTCWTRSISPLFSIFDVFFLKRDTTGYGRLSLSYSCVTMWESPVTKKIKVHSTLITGGQGFSLLERYDVDFIREKYADTITQMHMNAIKNITDNVEMTKYLVLYDLMRYASDVEAYYRSLIPSISREIKFVASVTRENAGNIDPMKEARMGWLADAAIQGNLFFVQSNMLEFWKEAISGAFGSEIKEWTGAIQSVSKNRKNSTSRIAKAYIATTYGTQLTLNDMQQWQNAVEKYAWKSYSARAFTFAKAKSTYNVTKPSASLLDGTCDYNYSLCYDPLEKFGGSYSFKELLDSFRLSPNAKRTWEILPFSFVIDWFLPVSELFQVIESEDTLLDMKYRIFGETSSTKYSFPFAKYPTLTMSLYSRTCSDIPFTVPLPDLEDLNPLHRGVSGSAAINGTALVLAGKRSM